MSTRTETEYSQPTTSGEAHARIAENASADAPAANGGDARIRRSGPVDRRGRQRMGEPLQSTDVSWRGRRFGGGGTTVTVETTVDADTIDEFYEMYEAAFGPLRTKAAARQVLNRREFVDEMTDPRVSKYVAWAADGRPMGLTTLTNQLETVPWISPEYFAALHPEHTARGAVYYLGFTLVRKSPRRGTIFTDMISRVLELLEREKAVAACDICAYNNSHYSFVNNIVKLLQASGNSVIDELDTQTYYCVEFTG